jgi:hypothetical protein
VKRFSRLHGGLNDLGLSANPFFAFADRCLGAIPNSLRLVIQIIQPFMAASSNLLAHLFPGAGSEKKTGYQSNADAN